MEPIWESSPTTRPNTSPSRKYRFEADSEDERMEDEIEWNTDELAGAAKRLKLLARAADTEVEVQHKFIGRLSSQTPCSLPSTSMTVASVLTASRTLDLIARPLSAPAPDEVRVAIKGTGICGSDLHYHSHFSVAGFPVLEPLTLGHESSGIVTALGASVTDFNTGDRVALEVGVPCSLPDCDRCSEGRYNICPKMQFRSSARSVPHFQGTLQEKINHPARWSWKLPDSVSLEEGALVEPLSVAIHAVRRSGIMSEVGNVKVKVEAMACLVLGAGTIGLMTAAVLRTCGIRTIVVADVNEGRIGFAVENGFADRGVVVEQTSQDGHGAEEKLEKAKVGARKLGKEFHYGSLKAIEGFDIVFECTGVESCVQMAIYATQPGGKVVLVGIGAAVQTLPIAAAAQREVDLIGVFRYASTYEEGIEMIAAANEGRLWKGGVSGGRPFPDLKSLITHRFRGLNSVKDAFDMASKGTDNEGNLVLKVMIEALFPGTRPEAGWELQSCTGSWGSPRLENCVRLSCT